MRQLFYHRVPTPLGELLIAASNQGIRLCSFSRSVKEKLASVREADESIIRYSSKTGSKKNKAESLIQKTEMAISKYFSNADNSLKGLPLDPRGTEFQKDVWKTLNRIPSGKTLSYGEVAQKIGRPRAVRAVGAACKSNPIGLITPCHRVIGKNKSLTGFAGGLSRKKQLLTHEGVAVENLKR